MLQRNPPANASRPSRPAPRGLRALLRCAVCRAAGPCSCGEHREGTRRGCAVLCASVRVPQAGPRRAVLRAAGLSGEAALRSRPCPAGSSVRPHTALPPGPGGSVACSSSPPAERAAPFPSEVPCLRAAALQVLAAQNTTPVFNQSFCYYIGITTILSRVIPFPTNSNQRGSHAGKGFWGEVAL